MADAVNAQITDAVTQSNTNVLGGSPAQSMGMVYQTMAHSISLTMQNAVSTQSGMQQINAAVIASACQKIMSLPTVMVAPAPPVQVQSPAAISPPASTTPPSTSPATPSSPVETTEISVDQPQPQPSEPPSQDDDDDMDIIDDELPG